MKRLWRRLFLLDLRQRDACAAGDRPALEAGRFRTDRVHPAPMAAAGAGSALRPLVRTSARGTNLATPGPVRSASVRTGVKDVVTLLVKLRRSVPNAMGVSFTRGMYSVSLAFKRRIRDRCSTLF
jgi:hypothetical protein